MSSILCLTLLSASSLIFASPLSTAPLLPRSRQSLLPAPLHAPPASHHHNIINNSYIVTFRDDVNPGAFAAHFSFLQNVQLTNPLHGVEEGLKHIWDSDIIKGYAGSFSTETVDLIRSLPEVDFVEHDQIVHTMETQSGAPWRAADGLARISHRKKLGFSTFQKYEFDKSGGDGVNVYVIDTGVYIDHVEFEGRATWGKTIPQNDQDIDGNGHGTHCAGTIASRKYGVAKGANIIAVKVLGTNGSGSMSDVLSGVNWAASDAKKVADAAAAEVRATGKTKHKGSVANMSLGGGKSRGLDQAVNNAVKAGLHFAVAAGNDNRDACDYSPAAAENAVTVGASTLADERAYFSNHGGCVDVFAPGLNIKSTWNRAPTDENTISGTSMASPHTAGLLAYLLSIYPSATFDPSVNALFPDTPMQLTPNHKIPSYIAMLGRAYERTYEFLPGWISCVMPPPEFFTPYPEVDVLAPIPNPVLTPAQLKKALIQLATKDQLAASTLPKDTPNILVFNNATDVRGKPWYADLA
ncbi:hypothetical protein BD410DRAFT_901059 [Rickenella mellea]|uniref:Serine-type endopeptidase n=1 Tax=Rickenella mellea TaxID=50990 RepID=A0A4Y7PSG8_9AGAM|nr:hypothetical protein BD410DRAFT_901059 [Rickenella mellea]